MATTTPPLPTFLDVNNQPVSTIVPDLIENYPDLPVDPIGLPVVNFINPTNALQGLIPVVGGDPVPSNQPAIYSNDGTHNQNGRLQVAFNRFSPSSALYGYQLQVVYSVTGYTSGTVYIKYTTDNGVTLTTLAAVSVATTVTTVQVFLTNPQNLSNIIIICEAPGEVNLTFNIYGIYINCALIQQTSLIPPFPGQQRIGDLMTRVGSKLGNRQDIFQPAYEGGVPQCADWIMRSVLELTQNYDFEELSTTGPFTNTFTAYQNQYLFNWLTNSVNGQFDVLTRVRSWFVTTVLSATFFNGQSTGYQLKYRDIAVVEQAAQIAGPPTMYSRVGAYYIIGPMPDNAYATYMRYQFQHPFSFDPNLIASIPIMMPTDWLDIVEYCAAQRGAMELRMLDYADFYIKTVYGGATVNPQTGKAVVLPGLISQRLTQRTRDMSKNERSIKPVVMRSCS